MGEERRRPGAGLMQGTTVSEEFVIRTLALAAAAHVFSGNDAHPFDLTVINHAKRFEKYLLTGE